MSAPRLTIPLVLEAPERVADGMGGHRKIWRQRGILYARMQAGSGVERQAEVGAESVTGWRITVRAAREGDARRPRPGQRFRMGTRVFRIEAVAEAGTAGLWLDCLAREEKLT